MEVTHSQLLCLLFCHWYFDHFVTTDLNVHTHYTALSVSQGGCDIRTILFVVFCSPLSFSELKLTFL